MTALVDARPPGVDALFRTGDVFTQSFEWPSGELAGRSFAATLDAEVLDVEVVADTMTVTVSAAQTAAAAQRGRFVLTDTTGGGSVDVIVGQWSPSLGPSARVSAAVEVAVSEGTTVAVTVAPAVASPEVVHDWSVDGWAPFTTRLVNDDDLLTADEQTLSVVAARGRVTNTGETLAGNCRIAYERDGTLWLDSEVCTLWWGGDVFDSGGSNPATPQCGHFHRGYVDTTGRWRAVVVTNNIFLSDTNVINANVWNRDPTQATPEAMLRLGSNGGSKTHSDMQLRRDVAIRGVSRISFGGVFNEYLVEPRNLRGIAAGVMVTADAELDATFDVATAQAVVSANPGVITLADAEAGSVVARKFEAGTIVPTTASARRYWPYWVKSQLTGNTLRTKVWRYTDPEPDWADTAAVGTYDFAGAQLPTPNAQMPDQPGRCGLIGAHLRNGRYLEYGDFRARQL